MRHLTPISPKLAALAHASIVGGNTGFFLLTVGESFRFPRSAEICIKTSDRGWYKDSTGHKFRTGTATAVLRILKGE